MTKSIGAKIVDLSRDTGISTDICIQVFVEAFMAVRSGTPLAEAVREGLKSLEQEAATNE